MLFAFLMAMPPPQTDKQGFITAIRWPLGRPRPKFAALLRRETQKTHRGRTFTVTDNFSRCASDGLYQVIVESVPSENFELKGIHQ